MKKISVLLFVLSLIAAPMVLSAQEQTIAGKVEFGIGSIFGFQYYTGDDNATNDKDISWGIGGITTNMPVPVNFGFFPIDNLSIGGSFYYTSYKNDSYAGGDNKTTAWEVRPTVRFYVPVGPQFLINAEGQYAYNTLRPEGSNVDTVRHGFAIGAGGTFLVTENLGIYGGVKYNIYLDAYVDGKKSDKTAYNRFDIDLGLRVFI